MLTFERRKMNILRESRVIGNKEYSNDKLLEILRAGAKRGIVDRLSPIAAESRLSKGMELGPIPGFSSRDIEAELIRCLDDPDIGLEMVKRIDHHASGGLSAEAQSAHDGVESV